MWRLNRKGFTLVEIMIVVAIIGLLAAIAIPNFVTARATAQLNACQSSIRTLQGAAELASFDGNLVGLGTAVIATAALSAALSPNYVRTFPVCPDATSTYSATATGVVTCSNAAHP